MDSRAYQFQLQAAEAAAAATAAVAPVVHAAEDGELEVTPKAPPLLKIQAAQGTAADEPASRQGSGGLAPTTTTGTIGNTAEATPTKCPECPKWFASEKAMFGHLRKHPERGYKGATRPTTATACASAAVAGDKKPTKKVPRKEAAGVAAAAAAKAWMEADELSTKWPDSVKRGRTPVAPVQQPSSCSEEEEAAMILLELASSSRTSSEAQLHESVEPVRAPDAAVTGHGQIQTLGVEEPALLDHPAGHQTPDPEAEQQIVVVQPENALAVSADSQTPSVKQVTDLVITTEAVLIVVPANKKAKKQRRVTNPSEQTAAASTSPPLPPPEGAAVVGHTPPARRMPSPASDKKHTCPTCGKSFPTHQALGGHMSYHVKGAKTTSARNDDLAAAQAMHNILAHRDQQSAANGNGNVTISASAGAGAGALQEHQEAQSPPAPTPKPQVQAPTPTPTTPKPQVQAPTPTPKTPAPHVCEECHLIFRSGQALGGHKRKHWLPEKQQAKAPAPAPAPALAPEPRDFDLNEIPMEGQGENNNQP